MDQQNSLMELEEAYDRLSCLLNALGLMVLGLMQAHESYADGFNAIWNCLAEADRSIQKCLSACQKTT